MLKSRTHRLLSPHTMHLLSRASTHEVQRNVISHPDTRFSALSVPCCRLRQNVNKANRLYCSCNELLAATVLQQRGILMRSGAKEYTVAHHVSGCPTPGTCVCRAQACQSTACTKLCDGRPGFDTRKNYHISSLKPPSQWVQELEKLQRESYHAPSSVVFKNVCVCVRVRAFVSGEEGTFFSCKTAV
jgi:hypothetical protein